MYTLMNILMLLVVVGVMFVIFAIQTKIDDGTFDPWEMK